MTDVRPLDRSRELLARAYRVIPSATQTFSKGPTQWAGAVSPHFLERGAGAWVWDVDGNRYLDHLMALGPLILGYADERVNRVVVDQLQRGIVFSQMHELEVTVAETLVEVIPCAEMVRFGKNGTDATSAAVRAARGITHRDVVAVCGYHGWQDWYIGSTTRDLGVPDAIRRLTETFTYNDLGSLERIFRDRRDDVAAVVLEPFGVVPPDEGFLEGVQELARAHGAVLIFDEIVTGFRLALGGAQEYFGVVPDLACFGKAMANGMPLSAVVGKASMMEVFDEVFFSGTFGGDTLALAACTETIAILRREPVLEGVWRYGTALIEGIQKIVGDAGGADLLGVQGYAPRSLLTFLGSDEELLLASRSFVLQECVKRGLLYSGLHVPSAAHGDAELEFALGVLGEVLPMFVEAAHGGRVAELLEGPPVQPVFRRV